MATDHELVDMLDAVWISVEDATGGISEDQWKTGTECPGWTVQDNVVHITALEAMSIGKDLPLAELPDDLPHVKNDFGRKNEEWIESRRSWSGADALAEFHTITRERIEGLRALDDAGFGADSWTPQGPGTVRDLLPFRIFDSWVHEQDIRRATDHPGGLTGAPAEIVEGIFSAAWPFVLAKRAAAPAGTRIGVVLDGRRSDYVVSADGRGRQLDSAEADVPDDPEGIDDADAVISLNREALTILGAGRRTPDDLPDTALLSLTGDLDLAGRVLAGLNVTP